ncbi:MAG: IS1 family transposase [Bdellovibrionales bacterium]|nr:IS1 family transposase [Bdellovibrionales bacterium]
MKRVCPHCHSTDLFHVRNGYFFRESGRVRVQRYRCKICRKEFSDATFQLRYRQRLRRINGLIERELISGASLRRIALMLKINYKTVAHRLNYLAHKARWQNERRLAKLNPICEVQFDDMETFEHTKMKPVSITLAVIKKQRFILGAEVSTMPAKGLLSKRARKKYGARRDGRRKARERLFKKLQRCVLPQALIESDENPHYNTQVQQYFPQCCYQQYKGRRGCVVGQGELKAGGYDPLFSLNHTCAMLRYSVSRLVRRTWVTTKRLDQLQNHIDIYINYHNRMLIA